MLHFPSTTAETVAAVSIFCVVGKGFSLMKALSGMWDLDTIRSNQCKSEIHMLSTLPHGISVFII